MSIDLVIQSPALDKHLIEQIAAIAMANGALWQLKTSVRLTDVSSDAKDREAVEQWCLANSADFAYVDPEARFADIKVLAMDMDSTLINIECIDEIADCAGVKAEVASITERAMRGEIKDFSESLRLRVGYLKGLPSTVLNTVYEERLRLNPGAETLIKTAQELGIKTLLVSGGFTFFTDKLKQRLNLDETKSNTLEIDDQGRLTGAVTGKIVDAQGKAEALAEFAKKHGVTGPEQIMAIGDGANDLKMLGLAGYSVAYRAKPVVRAQARYALNFSPLDAILQWFQDTNTPQGSQET